MINIWHIVLIVWLHYIADFVFQTDWMVHNKSKHNKPLAAHCWVYGLVFMLPSLFIFKNIIVAFLFCSINAYLHFGIDYITSRVSSKKYAAGKLGSPTIPNFGFFSIIGLDQALHYTCLLITYGIAINLKI